MLARSIYALIVAALAVLAAPAPSSAAESPCPSVIDHRFARRNRCLTCGPCSPALPSPTLTLSRFRNCKNDKRLPLQGEQTRVSPIIARLTTRSSPTLGN